MAKGYVVIEAAEGCAEVYVGTATTLRDARRLARRHERGEVRGTPEYLYETARAAGGSGVPGCEVPVPHGDDVVEWAGRKGYHAILRATE